MVKPAEVKLLLVDDMEELRNILRRLLVAMDFTQATVARNGQEAITLLRSQRLTHALENAPLASLLPTSDRS